MPHDSGGHEPSVGLGHALALVLSAIKAATLGLSSQPTLEEGRALLACLNDLRRIQGDIQQTRDALIREGAIAAPPVPHHVAEISRLRVQVDALIAATVTAAAALELTSKALGVSKGFLASLGGPHGPGEGPNA